VSLLAVVGSREAAIGFPDPTVYPVGLNWLATEKGTTLAGTIQLGDNLPILKTIPSASIPLIYIDPPFNTGKQQRRTRIQTTASENGTRRGFQGRTYETKIVGSLAFDDAFDDFLGFLEPRLVEAYRLLTPNGSMYLHLDYREVHYAKVLMDSIFGRECFLNEIIWAYDYGARSKERWPAKHDNILVYVKDPKSYVFNFDAMERIPYMAPGLVGAEKAALGKTPTDTWWHTIVPTNGKERTGYPTQKPVGILKRIVDVSSRPDDVVLDFFAGSGTTGEAAVRCGRRFHLIDSSVDAMKVMAKRFQIYPGITWCGFDPATVADPVTVPQASLFG